MAPVATRNTQTGAGRKSAVQAGKRAEWTRKGRNRRQAQSRILGGCDDVTSVTLDVTLDGSRT